MGEYIVDSCADYGEYVFDYYPNLYSDLTLSCIDLNAYAEARRRSEYLFRRTGYSLDVQNYPKLVRNRAKVRDFRKLFLRYELRHGRCYICWNHWEIIRHRQSAHPGSGAVLHIPIPIWKMPVSPSVILIRQTKTTDAQLEMHRSITGCSNYTRFYRISAISER